MRDAVTTAAELVGAAGGFVCLLVAGGIWPALAYLCVLVAVVGFVLGEP